MNDDDYYAIIVAKNVARRLLQHPDINPRQIIGLGNALYALDRLPQATPGACCQFSIIYRQISEEFEEVRYITFLISATDFRMSLGGTNCDVHIAEDHFDQCLWEIRPDGYRDTGGVLDTIEDSCEKLLSRGASIKVVDKSTIDYTALER